MKPTSIEMAETPCCLTGKNKVLRVSDVDRHGDPLKTVISVDSGLVYTDPIPSREEIDQFYKHEYRKVYKNVIVPKKKHILRAGQNANSRIKRVSKYVEPGAKMLDVGSGGGEFVFLGTQAGFDMTGIEPNEGYANYAISEYKVPILNGMFYEQDIPAASYDAVTLFHVLEHLQEPIKAIEFLGNLLRADGYLFVEVPSVDSRVMAPGQKWHFGHLFNFNERTLKAVGFLAGLHPVRVKSSLDGGTLTAVFQKREPDSDLTLENILAGSFETTLEILTTHSAVNHFLKPHIPLMRVLRKIKRSVNEKRTVKQYSSGHEILSNEFSYKKAA